MHAIRGDDSGAIHGIHRVDAAGHVVQGQVELEALELVYSGCSGTGMAAKVQSRRMRAKSYS